MGIHHITVELVSATSKSYTVRARVGITAGRFVEALAKEKSLEEAEEAAIQRARARAERIFSVQLVNDQVLSPTPPCGPTPPQEKLDRTTLTPDRPTPIPEPSTESAPASQHGASDIPVVADGPHKLEETTPQPAPLSWEEAFDALIALTHAKNIKRSVLNAMVHPRTLDQLDASSLDELRQIIESGPTAEDMQQVEQASAQLHFDSIDSLRTTWKALQLGGWGQLRPYARLIMWNTKETAKIELQAKEQQGGKTGGADLCDGPHCRAPIYWSKTQTGKDVPLDGQPHPVMLQGEGKGKKLYLINDGVAQLVDTWPVPPGAQPDSWAYMPHHATCPDVAKYRKQKSP